MSRETDEEIESQAEKAQKATPGGVEESGGPRRDRWRRQYREFTAPVRTGMSQAREWYGSLPWWANALVIVGLIAAAAASGIILGAPTLRLRGDYLAIVTLGFGEIVRITANNLDSFTNGAQGINQIPAPAISIGGLHYQFQGSFVSNPYYWMILAVVVVWIFLLRRVNTGRVGRAWAAIREDEVAAAAMGVPTVRMKLGAFAMGAAVASFGGVIYASWVGFISPDSFKLFGSEFASVIILAMVVLGGMGGFAGP